MVLELSFSLHLSPRQRNVAAALAAVGGLVMFMTATFQSYGTVRTFSLPETLGGHEVGNHQVGYFQRAKKWPNDEELLGAIALAEMHMRVFVYNIPDNIGGRAQRRRCAASSPMYFQAEQYLVTLMNQSIVRTDSVEDADFFLIPHDFVCAFIALNDRSAITQYFLPLLQWVHDQAAFKKRNGTDHVIVYTMDNGIFCERHFDTTPFREMLRSMIVVGNYGVADSPNCFRVNHDIVIPQWHNMVVQSNHARHNTTNAECFFDRREHHVFFKGQIIKGHECSVNARPILATVALNQTSHRFLFGQGTMRDAYFALAPAGWACWSARLYDALFSMTVPIIVADPVVEPFERFLDWRSFTTKIATNEIALPIQYNSLHNSTPWFLETVDSFVDEYETAMRTGYCNSTYLQRKRNYIDQVLPWLQWDVQKPQSAFGLFLLELWCRTPKAVLSTIQICSKSSTNLSSQSYWE